MFVEECKDAIVIDIVLIVAYVGDANPAVASTPSCCVTVEISASEIAPDFFAAVFLDVTQRPQKHLQRRQILPQANIFMGFIKQRDVSCLIWLLILNFRCNSTRNVSEEGSIDRSKNPTNNVN